MRFTVGQMQISAHYPAFGDRRLWPFLLYAILAFGSSPTPAYEKRAELKATPFPLQDVRLLDSPFKSAQCLDEKYLLTLDPERLLHNFRVVAGLPSTAKPLGGWEDPKCELRGHTVGHFLSACSLMYASTGDELLKDRVTYLVSELAKCQAALPGEGFAKGYLSAFPESFFDRVDRSERVWAPYYTLHKIMAGLLDAYSFTDNKEALATLDGMASWLKIRVDRLPHDQMQKALENEHGGMNEVLANLYAVSGNPDHLNLAQAFNHEAVLEPLSDGSDCLDGLHANTQIPKVIGAAREYELTGDEHFKRIATFFWERIALHRSYAIGGDSDREHFFPIVDFCKHLSPDTCETCNTYNMLKLTRHLFEWDSSAEKMDFYERALYNHILASQDPATGMFVYLMSLKPGHFKTYSTPENSFWCCVGTGMENHAKSGDSIYFHNEDSLFVNLFIPSEVTWKEKSITVRQETLFPEEETTRLLMKCEEPVEMALKIRHPGWVKSGMTVEVNGVPEKVEGRAGSFLTIEREWHDGDAVEIRLPMEMRLEPLPETKDTYAFLYGPIVLAGKMGDKDMPSPYAEGQTKYDSIPSPIASSFVCDLHELTSHIEPSLGHPLTFRSRGIGKPEDVTFIPFYKMHHQRYSVYWKVFSPEEWKAIEPAMSNLPGAAN